MLSRMSTLSYTHRMEARWLVACLRVVTCGIGSLTLSQGAFAEALPPPCIDGTWRHPVTTSDTWTWT